MEPGLVHEREKTERPKRDGLPAGVRPGHEQRLEVRPQLDVNWDDGPREARMAGAPQANLGPARDQENRRYTSGCSPGSGKPM